jgi:protein involved in polysaccharide export with SLBB domain
MKLIELSGGLADSAYYKVFQIKRYDNDKQILLDVKYQELKDSKGDFPLLPGDIVMVNKIQKPIVNFAAISGAVDFPKSYEIINGMKISDLVQKGVLSREARKDVAYLQRENTDGTFSFSRINLNEIMSNPSSTNNLELKPKDSLIVYGLDKFTDRFHIKVAGAVRNPRKYPFDSGQMLRIEDALILADGLKPEASDIAYVLRQKPDEPNTKEYIRVNLKNALTNKLSSDNLILQPSDSLFVISKKDFKDIFQVRIDGAVRNPGIYQYDESLNLKDIITLSGGLVLQAATNRVEVSRVVIQNNTPTRIVVVTLTVDDKFETQGGTYKLQPFDQISVRSVPEFEFQKSITIKGEVKYPGIYTLINKNETLSSVIERAGGLTEEAFKKGAQLYRKQDSIGYIVMDLAEALSKKDSRFNYILKENDVVTIPKMKDLVTIQGATKAHDVDRGVFAQTGQISAPFHNGKRANFYIVEYSGGFSKNAKRADVTVLYPNGKIKGTNNLGIFKIYPKPTKGSTIRVAYKELDIKSGEKKEKEKVDWEKLFANTIAQASGILTLILLAQQLSK